MYVHGGMEIILWTKITSIDLFPNLAPYDHNIHMQELVHWSIYSTSGQLSPFLDPKAGGHIERDHVDPKESHTHCVSSKTSGCSRFFRQGKSPDPDETPALAFCKPSLYPLQSPRGLSPVLHTNSSIPCDQALILLPLLALLSPGNTAEI